MVYYLSSNGTTVEDFNNFYGTSLEEGKDIVRVNYAGLAFLRRALDSFRHHGRRCVHRGGIQRGR